MGLGSIPGAARAYLSLLRMRAAIRHGPTLWIVSGPSSAGKTTFLASARCAGLTGLASDAPVIRPSKIADRAHTVLTRDAYLHYNISRPALRGANKGFDPDALLDYGHDPAWREIAELRVRKRAILLVVDRATLMRRVEARETRETWDQRRYRGEKWIRLFATVDLEAIYAAWRAELEQSAIPYFELDATRPRFPPLAIWEPSD
jgi:hypothetical protein